MQFSAAIRRNAKVGGASRFDISEGLIFFCYLFRESAPLFCVHGSAIACRCRPVKQTNPRRASIVSFHALHTAPCGNFVSVAVSTARESLAACAFRQSTQSALIDSRKPTLPPRSAAMRTSRPRRGIQGGFHAWKKSTVRALQFLRPR